MDNALNDATDEAHKLAGRLIMIRLFGTELDADTESFIRANGIRAACLFRQNMVDAGQLTRYTSDLRAAMGDGALLAIDQEGGAVVRTTWTPAPPSAMALGAIGDADLARAVGAAVARAVKALGFNWNFAPVLDLNNNPLNPVIAERSFGADPDAVTRIASAWMAGSAAEGVACCVKHFPGHGDTHVDSHRDLPTVDKPAGELARFEFAPFRACMHGADAAPAVMTAHILYPALDAQYPATMSRPILTGLLREAWGYDGVVITDGMDMHAIKHRYGVGEAAVAALMAGADMVMAIGSRADQSATVDAIAAAILDGRLARAEVAARVARLDALAARYPAGAGEYTRDADDRALMATAWRRALTLRSTLKGGPPRPAPGSKVRLVARQDTVSDGVTEAGVSAAAIAASLGRLYDVDLVTYADSDTFDWNTLPRDGRVTLLASVSRRRYGSHVRATFRPDLHLALWNPYQALDVDAPAVMTYGFAPAALDAVNAWLAGEIEAAGVCPVAGFGTDDDAGIATGRR